MNTSFTNVLYHCTPYLPECVAGGGGGRVVAGGGGGRVVADFSLSFILAAGGRESEDM